jgi:hypothetical protein
MIVAITLLAVSLGYLLWTYARRAGVKKALRDRAGGRLPQAADIIADVSPQCKYRDLDFVLSIIEPKARAGILQEESVLSAIHDRFVNSTNWLQIFSSASILLALVITFWNLNRALGGILFKSELTATDLRPVLELVGANWPLIGAGLGFYLLASVKQHLDWSYYYDWQFWLETKIFPELGVSRSTARQLEKALLQFNETAGKICVAVLPLSGLTNALGTFQTGLATDLLPTIKTALANVSVGLSDKAVESLVAATKSSTKAVEEIQSSQARIVTIVEASEQRSAKLVAVAETTAAAAATIAGALSAQAPQLTQNTTAMGRCTDGLNTLTSSTGALKETVSIATLSIDHHCDTTLALSEQVIALRATLAALVETAGKLEGKGASLQVALARAELAIARIGIPLAKAADHLGTFAEKTAALLSLADAVQKGTSAFESVSTQLSKALEGSTDQLAGVVNEMHALRTIANELRDAVASLHDGSNEVVKTVASTVREIADLVTRLENALANLERSDCPDPPEGAGASA